MKLFQAILIYAGGPGSGCNPDAGKCGRVGSGKLPRGRMGMEKIDSLIRESASEKKALVLDYGTDGGETKIYIVEPYSYRDNGKKFFAYDRMDKSIKAFNVEKIIRVQKSDVSFKPRWPIELGQKKIEAEVGEPGVYDGGYGHIDPIPSFHPPTDKNAKRVPTDDPLEDDDSFMDVTKRKSRRTAWLRQALMDRKGTDARSLGVSTTQIGGMPSGSVGGFG